ncbi:MAG: hypothetical protein RMJ98_21980, partial [Myxococcales bacterium]|nr:hypothetical protein [Polyangiaceae bacterium]MDW8251975.1 hypothetical protein [Myxococcales bacterium]
MTLRPGLRCLTLTLLGLGLLKPRAAWGQLPPPALEPPRLRSEVPVPYPVEGTGEHQVVLQLRVGIDGRVEEA